MSAILNQAFLNVVERVSDHSVIAKIKIRTVDLLNPLSFGCLNSFG
jgi:hypothetical protein